MADVCISCHGPVTCLGPLPGCNRFAGRVLNEVLPGGYLYRCRRCLLGFRHPRLQKTKLDALYASGSATAWEWTPSARTDWTLAGAAVRKQEGDEVSVLDIGCFDGGFLGSLNPALDRAGIEMMPAAAAKAEKKGVRIIGNDFACLKDHPGEFDVITAFDLIEHVESPLEFLELLAGALKPHGRLIVSTGNLDAWSWRLMKSRYWYCAIPEHISFLSERWFANAASRLELAVADCHHYAHSRERLHRKAHETLSNLAFLMVPRVIGAMRRRGIGNISAELHPDVIDEYPPGWVSATDHILVDLQKRPNA